VNGGHSEDVIHAEDGVFAGATGDFAQQAIESDGRVEILAERFFEDDTAAAREPDLAKRGHGRVEHLRRQSEIGGERSAGITNQRPHTAPEIVCGEIYVRVADATEERVACTAGNVGAVSAEILRDDVPERVIAHRFARGADDLERGRQLADSAQLGKSREEESSGKVTSGAKEQQPVDHALSLENVIIC
jgi:hypothetical protein